MKVAILSRKRSLYSTREIARAARELGHPCSIIDPMYLTLYVDREDPHLAYRTRRLPRPDVVIPRIGTSIPDYSIAAVAHFEVAGIPVVNTSQSIARAKDKFRCIQLLTKAGIATPRTVMVRTPANWRSAVRAVGGLPIVIKLIQGTQGIGVILAETEDAVESVLDTLWCLGQSIIIQEFVAASRGRDVRVFVIDGEVVCAMRRESRMGHFRSNLHRGGTGTRVLLDPDTAAEAARAAEVIGLKVAGVDILESPDGPRIIECNSSPGLEGIQKVTGVHVARAIIEYAERLSASPPPDPAA